MLFHTAGGGHVDALVMLSIAAAIYLLATDRALPATAVLTLGALVKVSAAVPLVLLIVFVVARTEPARRTRVLASHWVWRPGSRRRCPCRSCRPPTPRSAWCSWYSTPRGSRRRSCWSGCSRAPASWWRGHPGRRGRHRGGARRDVLGARRGRVPDRATGIAPRRRSRISPTSRPPGGGRCSLMMLFSPTLFPWYFCWVLPVAWALPMVPRRTLEISFLALCTSQLTTESFQLPGWMHINLPIGHPVLIVLLVWFLRDLWLHLDTTCRWTRHRARGGGTALPGVGFRSGAPGAREDRIEPLHDLPGKLDLERVERAQQLFLGARSDDGCGHHGPVQQPRKGDVGGPLTQLLAQGLPLLELVVVGIELLHHVLLRPAAALHLVAALRPAGPPPSGYRRSVPSRTPAPRG